MADSLCLVLEGRGTTPFDLSNPVAPACDPTRDEVVDELRTQNGRRVASAETAGESTTKSERCT